MPDTPFLLVLRILVVYTLYIFVAKYISYNVPSTCNNYKTLLTSEEVFIYNLDPTPHGTLNVSVYSY